MTLLEKAIQLLQGTAIVASVGILTVGSLAYAPVLVDTNFTDISDYTRAGNGDIGDIETNSNGEQPNPPEGEDSDGDGIPDSARHESDVCVDESFEKRFHADCLKEAGLTLPDKTTWSCDAMDELVSDYGIDMSTLEGYGLAIETITFQEAAIKTCRDLKNHENNMRDKRNSFRWKAIGAGILGGVATVIAGKLTGLLGSVAVAVVVALIVTVLWVISNDYGRWRQSAEDAEYELCRFR